MTGRAILAVLIAVTLVTGIVLAVADGERSTDVPSATPTDEDIINSPGGSPGTTDASPFGTTTPSPASTSPGTGPGAAGGTPAGASPTAAGTGGQASPTSGASPAGGQASPAPSPTSPSPVVSPGAAGVDSTGVAVTGPPALTGAAGLIPLLVGLFLFRRIRRPQA